MLNDYVIWRQACVAVAVAYENWKRAEVESQGVAFREYMEALDREERFARRYEDVVGQLWSDEETESRSSFTLAARSGLGRAYGVLVDLARDDRGRRRP